jgi:hypothetical protein
MGKEDVGEKVHRFVICLSLCWLPFEQEDKTIDGPAQGREKRAVSVISFGAFLKKEAEEVIGRRELAELAHAPEFSLLTSGPPEWSSPGRKSLPLVHP